MRWKISSRGVGRFNVRLLLDTAILIYAVEAPERLSKRAAATLENPGNVLELSAISITEIAIKTSLGKLRVTAAMARQAVQDLDTSIFAYCHTRASMPCDYSNCRFIMAIPLIAKSSLRHCVRRSP